MAISKLLAKTLRHRANRLGLRIAYYGFVNMKEHNLTLSEVCDVVRFNPKPQYEIIEEDPHFKIRALQGHLLKEMKDEELLATLSLDDPTLPQECIHGNYVQNMESIKYHGFLLGGFKAKSKNHVHYSIQIPYEKHVVGIRANSDIALCVDVRRAMRDGIEFFCSKNGFILSGRIDSKYIEREVKLTEIESRIHIRDSQRA
jgi:RNA:NAD 2'-phosphotransferase (TPT1/KptA family)